MNESSEQTLVIASHNDQTCDICNRKSKNFAIRQNRYIGLWVCLHCDTVIQKFLDITHCKLIRMVLTKGKPAAVDLGEK